MKDDDARSGEERPLLRRLRARVGRTRVRRPPLLAKTAGCCVDGKSREPSATDGPPTGPSCAPGDGPVLFSIEGGKWVPGGLSSLRRLTSNSTADEVNSAVREWAAHVVVLPPVERVTQRLEALRVLHAVGIHSAAALADAGIAEATMALARMLSERSASPR